MRFGDLNIIEIAHHRNGVHGESFYAVRFKQDGENFLATVFREDGQCAVISTDRLEKCGVRFSENSWRGDEYEPDLRRAIAELEAGRAPELETIYTRPIVATESPTTIADIQQDIARSVEADLGAAFADLLDDSDCV